MAVTGIIVQRHHPWSMAKGAESISHVFDVITDSGPLNVVVEYLGPYYTETPMEGRYNLCVKVKVNDVNVKTETFNAEWGFGARFHEWRNQSVQFTYDQMQIDLEFSVVSRMVFWSPRLELEHARLTVDGAVLMKYTSHADSSKEWAKAGLSALTLGFSFASHIHN